MSSSGSVGGVWPRRLKPLARSQLVLTFFTAVVTMAATMALMTWRGPDRGAGDRLDGEAGYRSGRMETATQGSGRRGDNGAPPSAAAVVSAAAADGGLLPTVATAQVAAVAPPAPAARPDEAAKAAPPPPTDAAVAVNDAASDTRYGVLPPPGPARAAWCDGPPRCVMDMGFNSGQDTHFYLADGWRVVAVDANPVLIAAGRQRYAEALANGSLVLVPSGLIPESAVATAGSKLTFFKSKLDNVWSSFDAHWGCRHPNNTPLEAGEAINPAYCTEIRVPTRTCAALVTEFGTPLYLKIDIEGRDTACLESLWTLPADRRPDYVSVENVTPAHIELLSGLGYGRQKVVDQRIIYDAYVGQPSLLGNSGPFGDAAIDTVRGKGWASAAELNARLPLPGKVGGVGTWYDLHGKRDGL